MGMQEFLELTPQSIEYQLKIHGYLHMLGVAILYYDHLITLKSEIGHIWARPKTQSAYLFFLNRYFAFYTNIAVLVLVSTTLTPEGCKTYTLFRQILLIVNQVLVCLLLAIRIYALYQRSKAVLTFMLMSGAVLSGIACFVMFGQRSQVSKGTSGCHTGLSKPTAMRLAGAWEALFVYDVILFSLTIFKTIREKRDRRITGINIDLITLILRDGCMYFAVMALCNLANILTFFFCGPYLRGGLSTFASATSSTMMSRLMLNLHESADEGIYTTNKTNTHFDYTISHHELGGTNRVELDTFWRDEDDSERGPRRTVGTTNTDLSMMDLRTQLGNAHHSTSMVESRVGDWKRR